MTQIKIMQLFLWAITSLCIPPLIPLSSVRPFQSGSRHNYPACNYPQCYPTEKSSNLSISYYVLILYLFIYYYSFFFNFVTLKTINQKLFFLQLKKKKGLNQQIYSQKNQRYRNYINLNMQEDQQPLIIQDQPLKVLGLFPKRMINKIVLDEQQYHRLFNTLCCTICQQLFNNPIYLKCSHRFCKQCLEKYIRINDKKSCPNCRGQLTTKRDLKLDFGISSLISYAFGNRNKFCQQLQQLENIQSQNLQKLSTTKNTVQSIGLVRGKSFAEQESKSPKKRVKTIDGQEQIGETRGRKKKINKNQQQQSSKQLPIDQLQRTQEIKVYSGYQSIKLNDKLPKTNDTIQETTRNLFTIQGEKQQYIQQQHQIKVRQEEERIVNEHLQEPFQVVKKKRGRKKKQVPILVTQSKSPDIQISEITNNNKINPPQTQPAAIDVDRQNIQQMKQLIQQQSLTGKRLPTLISVTKSTLTTTRQKPSIIITKPQTAIIQTDRESFQKERKLLQCQFGSNYLLKMMRLPILDFLIEIKLQRHPRCYFTPLIQCKSIQLSGKCKIHQIHNILAKFLNVKINQVKLYVSTDSRIEELIYSQNSKRTVIDINETYWKSAVDVQVFDMKQILSTLDENNLKGEGATKASQPTQLPTKKKKLFENIQVEREKALQPRKRGRGRTKKVQQKENIIEIEKEQHKRILYYRLVVIQ